MRYEVIDSHCHLDFPKFNRDRDKTIERAKINGVVGMINSGIDYRTNANSLDLARKYDFIHATLGLSPQMVPDANDGKIKQILSQMERNIGKAVGIGEAGLDYYYCRTAAGRKRQEDVFSQVIELADRYNKTLVIHGRDGEELALKMSRDLDRVIFHCYGGSLETMHKIVDAGHYVSVPTLVCFSESHKAIAQNLPLENMLIETDSPYLSPRKGRNEPTFVRDSVPVIAQLKEVDETEIAMATIQNTRRAFEL
ncbi:TatD family hydrolase [Methanolobus halotolerans]|uniref:TatD family deoxyribonuclease n=1 Tax=Methanolobus halotolerans TaxID=2052935 RepID=A0A4E0PUR0_9EURY|nr:TatD family hydrolase [Methanolobus halotolerans]TGC07216.1 TatD family deoxyribonuclease [Methanolobus halotolerans]